MKTNHNKRNIVIAGASIVVLAALYLIFDNKATDKSELELCQGDRCVAAENLNFQNNENGTVCVVTDKNEGACGQFFWRKK